MHLDKQTQTHTQAPSPPQKKERVFITTEEESAGSRLPAHLIAHVLSFLTTPKDVALGVNRAFREACSFEAAWGPHMLRAFPAARALQESGFFFDGAVSWSGKGGRGGAVGGVENKNSLCCL